jgi:hypothetical protein
MHVRFNERIVEDKKKRIILLTLIFVFPILFTLGMYWLRINNNVLYREIGREDGLIEWLQFFLFGASGVISFLLALKFRKVSKLMFVIFLIVSLGLIFVAGEEISWGQRIFNIDGHEVFDGETEIPVLKYNVQSETNLHNFRIFHSAIGYVYGAIGLYACFMWLFTSFLDKKNLFNKKEKKRYLSFFISPPYLTLYFLPLFVHFYNTKYFDTMTIRIAAQDLEMAEFLFSLGVFLCLLLLLIYFKKTFEQKENKERR